MLADRIFRYFKISSQHIITNQFILGALIFLEYITIFSLSLVSCQKLLHIQDQGENFLNYMSLIFFFRKLMICTSVPNEHGITISTYSYHFSYVIIVVVVMLLFFSHFFISMDIKSEVKQGKNWIKKWIKLLVVNFYDLFFFRFSGIFIADILVNFFINSFNMENTSVRYVFIILSMVLLVSYMTESLLYFQYFSMLFKLNTSINYPFDYTFSSKYDKFIFLLKILLCLENNMGLNSGSGAKHIMFMNIVIIFLIIFHITKILFTFFYYPSDVIYLTNQELNIIRLFLIFFHAISITFYLIFTNYFTSYFSIFLFLVITLLSIAYVVFFLKKMRLRKIIEGSDLLCKLYLLLDYHWNKLDYNKYLRQILICHIMNCKDNCIICKFGKESNIDIEDGKTKKEEEVRIIAANSNKQADIPKEIPLSLIKLASTIYKKLNAEVNYFNNEINNDHLISMDLLKISIKFLKNETKNFKLSVIFSKLISKYKKVNYNMAVNLMLFYHATLLESSAEIEKLEIIQATEGQCESIRMLLSELEQVIFLKENRPKNFVESTEKIRKLKNDLKNSLMNKHEYDNNYQSVLIRYILESGLNHKSTANNRVPFDISIYDEFLEFHYQNDKFLLLSYNIDSDSLKIRNAGKEFIGYKDRSIEDLFPIEISQNGAKCLIEIINKNKFDEKNNTFEYVIKDLDDHISSFKLRYTIFPSINNKEILIFGVYRIGYEEVVMFQKCERNNIKDEFLLGFSEKMSKILLIKPEMLETFLAMKNYFYFDCLFTSKPDNAQKYSQTALSNAETPHFEIKHLPYSLNYKQYLAYYKTYLGNANEEKNIQEYSDIISNFSNFEDCEKVVYLHEKIIIASNRRSFVIYSSKDEDTHFSKENTKKPDDDKIEEVKIADFNAAVSSVTGTKSIYLNSSSSISHNRSILSFMSSTEKKSNRNKLDRMKMHDEKMKKFRKFKLFTIAILFFNIALVCITLVFLVIALGEDIALRKLYDVYGSFNGISRTFYHSTLSLNANICKAQYGMDNCQYEFRKYSERFRNENNLSNQNEIYKYIERELDQKSMELQENLGKFKNLLYGLGNDHLTNLVNSPMMMLHLQNVGDMITISQDNKSFIEAIDIFVNRIESIVNTRDKEQLPIYIISINSNDGSNRNQIIDTSNIFLKNLSQTQLDTYDLIMNYSTYIKHMEDIRAEFKKQLDDSISKNQMIVYIFSVGLIIFHFLLLLLCLIFVSIFKDILMTYINDIMRIIHDDSKKKFLNKKYEALKTLGMFYQDSPNMVINRQTLDISAMKSLIKASEGNHCLAKIPPSDDMKDSIITVDNPSENFFKDDQYTLITNRYVYFLISLFLIYFVYSSSYFLILSTNLDKYVKIINYVDKNTLMDTHIYKNFGLIQLMSLTNQTDSMISAELKDTSSTGYTAQGIINAYTTLTEIEALESNHQNLIPKFQNQIEMNCDKLFKIINDSLIIKTGKLFESNDYDLFLSQICKSFGFMQMKNEKILLREINYLTQKLFNNLVSTTFDYDSLYQFNNDKILYDLYTVVLMLYRPLRDYENNSLYVSLISDMLHNYTLIVISYLVLNILVEMFLFFTIKQSVIKHFSEMNKNFLTFFKCIKV